MRTYLNTTQVIETAKKDVCELVEDIRKGYTIGIKTTNIIGENAILEVSKERNDEKITISIYELYFNDTTGDSFKNVYGKPIVVTGIGDLVKIENYIIRNMKKVIEKEL